MHDHSRSRRSILVDRSLSGLAVFAAGVFLTCTPALADAWFELHVDDLQAEGYALEEVHIAWDAAGGRLNVAVGDIDVDGDSVAGDLELRCGTFRFGADHASCASGRIEAGRSPLGPLAAKTDLEWRDRQARFVFSGADLAGGTVQVDGRWSASVTAVELEAQALEFQTLRALSEKLDVWSGKGLDELTGRLDMKANLELREERLQSFALTAHTQGLGFLGVNAAEELEALIAIAAERRGKDWSGTMRAEHHAGTFYVEPGLTVAGQPAGFTIEAPSEPLVVEATGLFAPESARVNLERLQVLHPGTAEGQASGRFSLSDQPTENDVSVRLSIVDLESFYRVYLAPLLLATSLDNLELAGQADLRLDLTASKLDALTVELDDVYFDDGRERFRGAGIGGTLDIGFDGVPRDSLLSWQGGGVYRIELGAGSVALRLEDRGMRLRQPLRVPVLDGTLQVDALELDNLGNADWSARLDAALEPLSLPEFCQAVGWPIMSGTLSGSLPDLSYRSGALQVGGVLQMQVFDGEVAITDLRLADLFGLVPRVQAEVDMSDLDLELLTRAFSFGKIEGRLDGRIHGLRMQNWQPVQFDAAFATPLDDDSRHRISQQAVDNLTSIGGGGATAALSRGFLGFLKEFSYDRIGIGCRLRNGVCTMRGVEHFEGGYAIVTKGLLPPWISIKGFNHRVSWRVLVDRLKSAVASGGPMLR